MLTYIKLFQFKTSICDSGKMAAHHSNYYICVFLTRTVEKVFFD